MKTKTKAKPHQAKKRYSYYLIGSDTDCFYRIVPIPVDAPDHEGFRSRFPNGTAGLLWCRSEFRGKYAHVKRVSRKRALQLVPYLD